MFSIISNILIHFTQLQYTQHKHSMLFCCYACTALLLEHRCLELKTTFIPKWLSLGMNWLKKIVGVLL